MTKLTKQQPSERIQDGNLTIAIWKNESSKGTYYVASAPKRSYKDKNGNYQNTTSLRGSQLLKAQALIGLAYTRIRELEAADHAARKAFDQATKAKAETTVENGGSQ